MVELCVQCVVPCVCAKPRDLCCSQPARVMRKFLGSAFLRQAAAVEEVSASKPCDSFGFHLLLLMPELTDSELAQLTRQHLKSHGADWELLEPFINRVLRPWESVQVLVLALFCTRVRARECV